MSWAVSWRLVVFLAIKTVIVYLMTLFMNSLLVVWAAVVCEIVIFSYHWRSFIEVRFPLMRCEVHNSLFTFYCLFCFV